MPVAVTYPGVYIEELPSGNRTITGVATSITAFVGRTAKGPVNEPRTLFSFGDYERTFGELSDDYPVSFAVNDFFLNGGSQAIVVRLFKPLNKLDETDWNSTAQAAQTAVSAAVNDSTVKTADDAVTQITKIKGKPEYADVQSIFDPLVAAVKNATGTAGNADWKAAVDAYTPTFPDATTWNATAATAKQEVSSAVADSTKVQTETDAETQIQTIAAKPEYADVHSIFDPLTNAVKNASGNPAKNPEWKAAVDNYTPTYPDANAWKTTATAARDEVSKAVAASTVTTEADAESEINTIKAKPAYAAVQSIFGPLTTAVKNAKGKGKNPDWKAAVDAYTPTYPTAFAEPPSQTAWETKFKAAQAALVTAATQAASVSDATRRVTAAGQKLDDPARAMAAAMAPKAKGVKTVADYQQALSGLTPGSVLPLVAIDEGSWGRRLTATVSFPAQQMDASDPTFVRDYKRYGVDPAEFFNLTVTCQDPSGVQIAESYLNLTLTGGTSGKSPSNYKLVLQNNSDLVHVPDGATLPASAADLETLPIGFDQASGVDSDFLDVDDYTDGDATKSGLHALEKVDLFNLLCIPPDTPRSDTSTVVYQTAAALCQSHRAFLIIDPPVAWTSKARLGQIDQIQPTDLNLNGDVGRYAAVYFPRVRKGDPTRDGQVDTFPACGAIAGLMASTDVARGVWKAPAGQDVGLNGIAGLELGLSNAEQGLLNPIGINCLRTFPVIGSVIWGARTLRGADQLSDDYKYVSVRRLTNYIEESLYRGTQWAVFEPNDERLWSSLRLAIGTFMADLSRQGAFYSYQVACDKSTTTPNDIAQGIVRVQIMFAPVDPAEFVILTIQQQASTTT